MVSILVFSAKLIDNDLVYEIRHWVALLLDDFCIYLIIILFDVSLCSCCV